MTTTATAPVATDVPRGTSALTGTGTLLRLMLRRDRVRLPAWVLGISVFVPYFFTVFNTLFPTREDLLAAKEFAEGPIVALLGGPGYGLGDDVTLQTFFAAVYVLYFLVAAGFMKILLVSRHTRVEEQTGRAELVRANVVGRHAPLTAALTLAVLANGCLAVLLTLGLVAYGAPFAGAALLGCGVAALGLVFAGITATTVQISGYSRVATAMSSAVLGGAFAVRAAGDMLGEHGSALSWLSPFAWSQQTRAFVDDRWWPLAISLAVAVATAATGFALSRRRDVGAGLWASRPGPAHAPGWLRGQVTLAWRLHRSAVRGWAAGLVIGGLVYGATTQALIDAFDEMNPQLAEIMRAEEDPVLGYLALMISLMVITTAVYVVLAAQRVRSEELEGRAEPVLATATSKTAWLGGHLLVIAVTAVVLVSLAGLATGVSAAAVTGEASHVGDLLLAGLVASPALLVVVGLAALLYGVAPRLLTLTWAVVVLGGIIEFFGPLLDPPSWLASLSPWQHTPAMPLEPFTAGPLLVQAGIAVVTAALGLRAFHRRDLESA